MKASWRQPKQLVSCCRCIALLTYRNRCFLAEQVYREQMTRGTRNSMAAALAAAEADAVAQATGLAQIARPGQEETQQKLLRQHQSLRSAAGATAAPLAGKQHSSPKFSVSATAPGRVTG
jgi:hypothetical protein